MKQLTFFPVEKFGWVTISAYFEVKSADNPIWRYILKGVTSTLEILNTFWKKKCPIRVPNLLGTRKICCKKKYPRPYLET